MADFDIWEELERSSSVVEALRQTPDLDPGWRSYLEYRDGILENRPVGFCGSCVESITLLPSSFSYHMLIYWEHLRGLNRHLIRDIVHEADHIEESILDFPIYVLEHLDVNSPDVRERLCETTIRPISDAARLRRGTPIEEGLDVAYWHVCRSLPYEIRKAHHTDDGLHKILRAYAGSDEELAELTAQTRCDEMDRFQLDKGYSMTRYHLISLLETNSLSSIERLSCFANECVEDMLWQNEKDAKDAAHQIARALWRSTREREDDLKYRIHAERWWTKMQRAYMGTLAYQSP